MRIAYLIHNVYGIGGTIRTVMNQAEGLSARHEVEIVSVFRHRERPRLPLAPHIAIRPLVDLRLPAGPGVGADGRRLHEGSARAGERPEALPVEDKPGHEYSLLTDDRLREYLETTAADVVVGTRPGLNVALARLAPDRIVKVGQEHLTHDMHSEELMTVMSEAYRNLDALVTVTEADAARYRDRMALPGVRVLSIPNSVPAPPLLSEGSGKTVVAAGRLVGIKRYDLLIEAFSRVLDRYPDWTLRIYGTGERMGALRSLVASLGVGDNVLLMGRQPHIAEAWALGSIAAVTSREEPFGMTIVEAMRSGLPVVSTDCPLGPREIIRDGEDGLLVGNGDAAAVADGLRRLMADDDARRRMSAAALRNSARFDPRVVTRRHEELFADLAGVEPAGVPDVPPEHSPPDDPACVATVDPRGTTRLEFTTVPDAVVLHRDGESEVRLRPDEAGVVEVDPAHPSLAPGTWAVSRVDGTVTSAVSVSLIDARAYPLDPETTKRLCLTVPMRADDGRCEIAVRRSERHAEVRSVTFDGTEINVRATVLGATVAVPHARLWLRSRHDPRRTIDLPCPVDATGEARVTIPVEMLTAHRHAATDTWELAVSTGEGDTHPVGRGLEGIVDRRSVVSYPRLTVHGTDRGDVTATASYTPEDRLLIEVSDTGTDTRVTEALGEVTARVERLDVEWHGGDLHVTVETVLTDARGRPLTQRRGEDGLRWVNRGGEPVGPDLSGLLAHTTAELSLTSRRSGRRVPMRTGVEPLRVPAQPHEAMAPRLRVTGRADIRHAGQGKGAGGTWEATLSLRYCGTLVTSVVTAPPGVTERRTWPTFHGPEATFACAYESGQAGRLTVTANGALDRIGAAVPVLHEARVVERGGELELVVPMAVTLRRAVEATMGLVGRDGGEETVPATLSTGERGAVLRAVVDRAKADRLEAALLELRRDGRSGRLGLVLNRGTGGTWWLTRLIPEGPFVDSVEWDTTALRVHGRQPAPYPLTRQASLSVLLRRRGNGHRLRVPVELWAGDGFTASVPLPAEVGEGRLGAGVWDAFTEVTFAGISAEERLGARPAVPVPEPRPRVVPSAAGPVLATAYYTRDNSNLSLETGRLAYSLPSVLEPVRAVWRFAGVLEITAPSAALSGSGVGVRLHATASDGTTVMTPMAEVGVGPRALRARVPMRSLLDALGKRGGAWRLCWRLVDPAGGAPLADIPLRIIDSVPPSRWFVGAVLHYAKITAYGEGATVVLGRVRTKTVAKRRIRRVLARLPWRRGGGVPGRRSRLPVGTAVMPQGAGQRVRTNGSAGGGRRSRADAHRPHRRTRPATEPRR